MVNQKISFETKFGIRQYLFVALRSLIVVIPTIGLAVRVSNNRKIFYTVVLVGAILSMFLILRSIKTFQITNDHFIVKRCVFKNELFKISEIKKIVFFNIHFGRGSGIPIMRIISKNSENEFGLIYLGKELEKLITNLNKINIDVENNIDYNR